MNKRKGSALLIVIILAVALTITVNGSLVSRNNLAIMKSKYSEIIQDHYSKDTNNLEFIYNEIERRIN